mgnify:CR=1 FL=1
MYMKTLVTLLKKKVGISIYRWYLFVALALDLLTLSGVSIVSAHCDSYDGPVITDARKALGTKNVKPI